MRIAPCTLTHGMGNITITEAIGTRELRLMPQRNNFSGRNGGGAYTGSKLGWVRNLNTRATWVVLGAAFSSTSPHIISALLLSSYNFSKKDFGF